MSQSVSFQALSTLRYNFSGSAKRDLAWKESECILQNLSVYCLYEREPIKNLAKREINNHYLFLLPLKHCVGHKHYCDCCWDRDVDNKPHRHPPPPPPPPHTQRNAWWNFLVASQHFIIAISHLPPPCPTLNISLYQRLLLLVPTSHHLDLYDDWEQRGQKEILNLSSNQISRV